MEKKENSEKSLLLVADLVGYGNLALTVMMPILNNMRYKVYNLPTSLISNNFSYGQFAVLDTTTYMRDTIKIWESLNFTVDAVCTGYLLSEEQADLVANYCSQLKLRGTRIFVDPVMADDGKLYNGSTLHTVAYMRKVCAIADVILPNFTEARFLADKYLDRTSLTMEEAEDLLLSLHKMGSHSVVITSAVVEDKSCTLLYDGADGSIKIIHYDLLDAQFSGTGDLFSAILIGKYQDGCSLESSVATAMNFVYDMIQRNQKMEDTAMGIPIEKYVDMIP